MAIFDEEFSIFAYTHITPNEKQFLIVYRSERDFECLQIFMILPLSKYGECPIFRNRTPWNASQFCNMLRVSLKLTNMYIQINKNALSLEEEKQISHEAQQVEELWRTLSYCQWLSVYFNFRILSWDGVHGILVNSSETT